jgi:hypothetical protein
MSIVRLSGGLGNQLFQYCFGIHLQNEINQEISFDISQIKKYGRKLELDRLFPLKIAKFTRFGRIFKTINTMLEGPLICNREISLQKNTIYSGNFISPRYWESEYSQTISMVELSLRRGSAPKLESEIAMHVRRGDYFYSEKTRQIHGYCTDEYFLNALETACRINPAISTAYVSTDSPELIHNLVKKIEMRGVRAIIVSENDPVGLLKELSTFRNFIGSNSTFSWWVAALFGPKLVYMPEDWFLIENLGFNVEEQLTFEAFTLPNALSRSPVIE